MPFDLSAGYKQLFSSTMFVGLMIASVGRALYPGLTLVAAPFFCDGEAEAYSSWFRCLTEGGGGEMAPFGPMFIVTTLIYGGGLFVIAVVLKLITSARNAKG